MNCSPRVLLIIAAYNEEECISGVIDNIIKNYSQYDYIIINDGSTDHTADICKNKHYNFITLPINLGIGGAIQTGYKYAQQHKYDIAVQLDGDGQHDPKYIEEMIRIISSESADYVIGSRFIEKKGFQSSRIRRAGISFLSSLIYILCFKKIYDVTSGYRAINRAYIAHFADEYPTDYPEPKAIIDAIMNRAKIQEIPVVMKEREGGISSINFTQSIYYMIKVTLDIIICRIGYGFRRRSIR